MYGRGPHIQLDLFASGVNLQTARRVRPAGGRRNVVLARFAVQQLHLQNARARADLHHARVDGVVQTLCIPVFLQFAQHRREGEMGRWTVYGT